MKLFLFVLIFQLCMHVMRSRAWAAEKKESRVVTISTLCLLDADSCRTADYVAGMIEEAARRGRPDLIGAPLPPFPARIRHCSSRQVLASDSGSCNHRTQTGPRTPAVRLPPTPL